LTFSGTIKLGHNRIKRIRGKAMGLDLGRIPFSQGYKPSGRSGVSTGSLKQGLGGVHRVHGPVERRSLIPDSVAGVKASFQGSRLAELSIRPSSFGPPDVRFLLGASGERMGRSVAASLGSHVVGFGLLAFLISLVPETVYEVIVPNRESYSLVWIPEEGPGGGGGGGGNESLELSQQVELAGVDETPISIPIQEISDFIESDIEPEVLETQRMNIPAMPMAAAPRTRTGVLDGLIGASTDSQGSGSGGGGGAGEGNGIGPGTGPGLGPGEGGGVGGGVYRPGAGIINPELLRNVEPGYTSDAMRAKIEGTVHLEIVVLPDGTVGDVTIVKSLDAVFGLDQEAIKAVRQWRFRPATRFGEPVAFLALAELSFNLR